MRFLIVALAGFLIGGWAVPLGFWLGLSPLVTFLTSAGGGLAGCWAFILVGDRVAAWWRRRRGTELTAGPPTEDEETAAGDDDAAGRVGRFVDRYGVRGLGIVGPIFPGVTVSVAGGLALGLDRRELGKWMTIGIIVMYGLYTLGAALLVYLF
jgi:hypothetical protein